MIAFDRYEQILVLEEFSATFSVGERIAQPSTGVEGIITAIDSDNNSLYVTPFAYYGFNTTGDITHKGNTYNVLAAERNYNSAPFGANAKMKTRTEFATGRIASAKILNSGFGYVDNELVYLTDNAGKIAARAILKATTQGITSGYWGSETSHLNGYTIKEVDNKPLLPTYAFANEILKVAASAPTVPVALGTWGQSIASDGYAYFDILKDGNIISADALMFIRIIEGKAPQEVLDRWNNIIVPSMKEQSWFIYNPQFYKIVEAYEYYDSRNKIQDSDRYQEYSYEVRSTIGQNVYEDILKKTVHLAGTKMFGEFVYKKKASIGVKSRFTVIKKEDYIVGGDPIVGPNQPGYQFIVTADNTAIRTDSENLTVDISQ